MSQIYPLVLPHRHPFCHLYRVPCISKKTSNRLGNSTKPTFLTSSQYKLDLETSIKEKKEAELLKIKRNMTKELGMQKKTTNAKKNTEEKPKNESQGKMISLLSIQNKPSLPTK